MRRLAIRVANAALFVVCCYATAGLFNLVSREWVAPLDEAPGLALAEAPRETVRSATRSQDINRRNLFGSKVITDGVAIEPEPEPEPVATITKLPLKLLGTAAFENDLEWSRAAIGDAGGNKPEVVGIGEYLESHPSVQIAAISAREVILDNKGSREILRLDDEEAKEQAEPKERASRRTPSRRSSRASSSRSRDRGASRSSRRSGSTSLADNLKKLAERTSRGGPSAAALLSQAQILPKYDGGEMVGIELSGIQSGSLYEQLGLKEGDVISEIAGVKIDSPSVSQKVLSGLGTMTEISGIVNGEPFTVSADKIKELMESGVLGP